MHTLKIIVQVAVVLVRGRVVAAEVDRVEEKLGGGGGGGGC
jgi:hypothetical protein